MANLEQKTVIPDNTKQELLPAWYYDAFALRMLGATYKKIAQETNHSEAQVKKLFARGGKLYELWQRYVTEGKADALDETVTMLHGNLPDMARAAIMTATTAGNMPGVVQRKHLFDFLLGTPEQRLKIDARITTFADWVKMETIKRQQANQEQTDNELHTNGNNKPG